MRKIDIRPYDIEVQTGENTTEMKPFQMKQAFSTILFHPSLELDGREVILRDKLANKIEEAEDEILLEETDYSKIKMSAEKIKGFNREAVEFLNRIFNAEKIEVEEKQ